MKTAPRNGKTLTQKGTATRDRIVAAAAKLIHERGVAGTTIDDVRDAASVSSSQFYHYFQDKMALVREVIAFQTEAVLASQGEFLGRLDNMKALHRWRDLLVRIQRELRCEGGCPLGSLSNEIAEVSPEFRLDLNRAFMRWEDGIGSGLRAMHERGELRKDADPDRLATALLAAVQGGFLLTQARRNSKPLEAAVDAMLDHIESLVVSSKRPRARDMKPKPNRKLR